MLHYNPQHISSSTMLIFRRTNCIITASGVVTLCKRPYSMPAVESGQEYSSFYVLVAGLNFKPESISNLAKSMRS